MLTIITCKSQVFNHSNKYVSYDIVMALSQKLSFIFYRDLKL